VTRLRSIHRGKLVVGAVAAVAIVLVAVFDPPWVVESIGKANAGSAVAGSANLSPDKYVAAIWATKVLPTVKASAVDLPTLLAALRKDRAAASKRYGHYSVLNSPPAFLIKGSGRIVSVDTASLISKIGVALGSGAKPDVFLQIGPIISGTDIRDALPFINFNQFVNQVQFGEVAIALNSKVRETALTRLDQSKLKGKHITFTGAFTDSPATEILITPITVGVSA
jgi:predicted lipoprotein